MNNVDRKVSSDVVLPEPDRAGSDLRCWISFLNAIYITFDASGWEVHQWA